MIRKWTITCIFSRKIARIRAPKRGKLDKILYNFFPFANGKDKRNKGHETNKAV